MGDQQGATWLYTPVGGAGERVCIILNMLHVRDPFFKIKKYLQIIYKWNFSGIQIAGHPNQIRLIKICLITPPETWVW